jgi:HAMP domain-containing protein
VSPLRSVAGRLALWLLFVVAGVLAIVYLIVVPSYRNALETSKLASLEDSMRTVAVPNFPAEFYLQQQFASTYALRLNARIVVYDLLGPGLAPLEPAADSNQDGFSSDAENDPVAFAAAERQALARGTVARRGQTYAEVAYPLGSAVILLAAPLHDQLQTVAVVRQRVFLAGALALAFAVALAYAGARLHARRIKRLEAAADRIASGRFDEAVVDSGSYELGQLARTFELMRLRLADLDRARGEFIANASH